MTHERQAHIHRLFGAALDQPPAERAAFLRAACGDDDALYDEVWALLDVEVHPLLDEDTAFGAAALLDDLDPDCVGPWRLGRRLGTGGMGTVYLAERADGAFEQVAALKLVKRGMDTEAVLARFQAERQLLARFDHPNIARLLDGGQTEDGRPYFVMEYVDGEPITAYCDRRHLPVAARLALFEVVCEAVEHAHRRLVVHRDLKPSNILVADGDDGQPVVKLLDFGIAKLLLGSNDGSEDGVNTQTGQRLLTPAYAAPEQLRAEPVTTATDVFGLGLVLYELLTGRHPFRQAALEDAILHATPTRPSTLVQEPTTSGTGSLNAGADQATDSTEAIAEARRTSTDRLRRRLRGDIDTICLHALEKEPERRYPSAAALLADLRRERTGVPIEARAPSAAYRVRKFVERHRAGVGVAVGAALALAVVVTLYTWRLAAERDRAQLEAAKAQEVTAVLTGLFEQANPLVALGESLTVRAVLDSGAVRIPRDLEAQPELQASLLIVLGDIYSNLGDPERAIGLYEGAVALRRAEADPRLLAGALWVSGTTLRSLDRTDEARGSLEEALRLSRQAWGPEHAETARVLSDLGMLDVQTGDYEAAETRLRLAETQQRALGDAAVPDLAKTLGRLGLLYERFGRLDDAAPIFAESLALNRQVFGDAHPNVAAALQNLGIVQRERGDDDAAETAYREGLAINEHVYGADHPETATAMRNLASVLRDRGAYDEAEALYLRAYDIRAPRLGPTHPTIANLLNSLGTLYVRRGDLDQAAATYRRALDIYRADPDVEPSRLAPALHNLAGIHEDREAYDEAEALYREALQTLRAGVAPTSTDLAFPLTSLGSLLASQGTPGQAVPLLREAVRLRRDGLPPDHRYTARSEVQLARALQATGQTDGARDLLTESLARLRVAEADSSLIASAAQHLAALPSVAE
ncbi:MAG: tetratricopeptide repeat protein [Bacteroidota bacterium]